MAVTIFALAVMDDGVIKGGAWVTVTIFALAVMDDGVINALGGVCVANS